MSGIHKVVYGVLAGTAAVGMGAGAGVGAFLEDDKAAARLAKGTATVAAVAGTATLLAHLKVKHSRGDFDGFFSALFLPVGGLATAGLGGAALGSALTAGPDELGL